MLAAASTASAQALCFGCKCWSSCDNVCHTGPLIPDCPECNQSTCGEWGVCDDLCEPGECDNGGYTTTLNGTSGGDNLSGSSAHERINGFGGADTINGNAGNDQIFAGDGNDTASGGSGEDCLFGEDGNDNLTGDTGFSDEAHGGPGTDTCNAEVETTCEL
jgi:hypothetical protein